MPRGYVRWVVHPIHDGRPRQRGVARVDVDREPCPIVSADGIAAAPKHRAWLEVDREAADAPMTDAVAKPPYRVPTMDEVRAVPWNGMYAVSTFSGGGGSSTGLRLAGFRVAAAVEFVPRAQESYVLNMAPHTRMVRKDVRDLTAEELLGVIGMGRGELDLLDGSPPCEPFSSAGKRDKHWGEVREYSGQQQRSDDLFYEYARLVEGLQPRAFVAENVAGLVRGRAKGYFKLIHRRLSEAGYRVEARLLDAQWLGVPQTRQRLIFVGVREDLPRRVVPAFPDPLPYRYTVRDALPHIFRIRQSDVFDEGDRLTEAGDVPATVTAVGMGAKRQEAITVEEARDPSVRMRTAGAHQGADRDRADEPVPAITSKNKDHLHVYGEGRVSVEDANGYSGHENVDVTDAPAPCVQASRPVHVEYDTGGQHSPHGPVDVTDRPSPAIRNGGGNNSAAASNHYKVVEPKVEPRVEAGSFQRFHDKPDVTDQPCPAILSGQPLHYQVVEGADEMIVGNEGFEPKFGVPDVPSPTVMAGGSRTSGEVRDSATLERRKFTIDELKAICAFPPDYRFAGSYSNQWERLGDSVPPLMMLAIAAVVRDEILLQPRTKRKRHRGAP